MHTPICLSFMMKSPLNKNEDLINLNVMSIATKKVVSVKADSALDEAAISSEIKKSK